MKRGVVFLLVFFMLIASISIVSATYSVNNYSITKQYGPSEYIKGWINISLNNEPTNSLFETNFEDSISLINLIKEDTEFIHSCAPIDCETDYSASEPNTTKTFSLDEGESTIFGFKFTGNLIAINSVEFTIESDALSSCYYQLKIDFFNDEIIDVRNNKTSEIHCDNILKKYGCFDENKPIEEYSLSETPYCQKIRLTESPGFKLGAWVKEETAGDKNLTMALHDPNGYEIETCDLSGATAGSEISCDINYSATGLEDYYVCIYSDAGSGEYKIIGNKDPSIGCGFYGIPIQTETPGAYRIFAEGKRFGAVGILEISNSLPGGDTLGGKAYEYIRDAYGITGGYVDCSADCIVPVKFISGENQNIIIRDLEIKYQKTAGEVTENDFYDLSETPATIDAEFQKLYLDYANFSVPDDFGDYTFSLSLNNDEIFDEEITVEKIPQIISLNPYIVIAAYPTEFVVEVETFDSSANITSYEWDFGNNDTETTIENKIVYTYNSLGEFELTVTITDSNLYSSSKTFEITVETPKKAVNTLLTQKLGNLDNIKAQIDELPLFHKTSLNSIFNLTQIENDLAELQNKNNAAVSDQDYVDIMTDLLKLTVPRSIIESESAASISFYPDEENINLRILKEIGGGEYNENKKDEYVDAILAWNLNNINVKIDYSEYSAVYEDITKKILRIFELKINENSSRKNSYLIIPKLDDLEFKEDYSETEKLDYIYIDLTSDGKTIAFSTSEDVSFIDLPLFISPGISELSIVSGGLFDREKKLSKLTIFILILFLLVIIGFVVYIILQTWYKKKYENYLFKNRNDLYNLISYIQSSKKKGFGNKEIITKLKRSGWKSEQIKYIMKKYSGKRTGMFEIPIGKILSRTKKSNFNQKGTSRKRFFKI